MSNSLEQVRGLVARGEVRVSLHGYEELATDGITVRDAVDGLAAAVLVQDYPDHPRGPCLLVLEKDGGGRPIHVVWGIQAGQVTPAVLITAYKTRPREVGRDMAEEARMSGRSTRRLVREGEFVAEVEVELVEAQGGWTPYLSLPDAYKLDNVREALRAGDIGRASQLADRVYRLTPVQG